MMSAATRNGPRTRLTGCLLLLACVLAALACGQPASAEETPFARIEQRYRDLVAAGKHAAALAQARKLVAVTRSQFGERHAQYVAALEKLGLAHAALGQDRLAVAVSTQAVEIARSKAIAVGTELADALTRMADRYDPTGRQHVKVSAYTAVLRIGLTLLKRQPRTDELKIAKSETELAAAFAEDGELDQAVALQSSALAIRTRILGADNLALVENLRGLAALAARQERGDDAERYYHRALVIQEATLGPTDGEVADTLEQLADILPEDRGREAGALRERATVIRRTDRPSFARGFMRPGMRLAPPPGIGAGRAPRPF
jgi:eukaryotic-like serine/threonine-protein kinase